MKLGSKALGIALVMALAAVPAALAGNGHGGGKPSWAGQGKPSWAGQGKPSWAGQGHAAHSDKAKKPKHQQDGSADDGTQSPDLQGLNPAEYCRAIQDEANQLASDFASMFGTNPNNANAFGKCVSRRAHGEDLSGAAGGDQQENSCDTTSGPQDESSGDQASDPGSCGNDGSASDESAGDEQAQGDDEQGEDDQGQDEGNASDEAGSSDLANALRFLRL
jgi:hypothetical protein